ncbi:NAD(P)-dependent oxidoreductase [Pseudomonas sp. MH9.2]|uniref:NAD-dependent epimerase/dehydratase family protein n=1 Tax=unclassified Pseudomonas TaxID=196821 RepID=UPI002AC992F4|nr:MULTISPECIES: NAD(P)-dependent oxidoreductase [unclassified Pseudomonas]MEB0028800.1 NAD(P)-dependent oxidoreductase [Pseudomonas sp. MH9.2]MEB0150252.1 NAD(P)-dependent oxidoreductase [Pseudomonas sp. CCC2.2]MEE3507472.1 NAD(P)-dependent oxidoreductase [Pseudomonas sp. 10C3]WPX68853.1 NAD(P)-dependent oxidoreductase [Pseudomonas sp. MH9.2]
MAILVTGGKGFIGASVIKNLVERGEEVVCLELKDSPGRLGDLASKIGMVVGDITDYDSIAATLSEYKIDRIAHMVFFSAQERGVSERPEQADQLYKQQMIMNTGTFHLFEAARLAGVKRVVFPSSVQYHGLEKPWTIPGPITEESPALPSTTYGIGKHLCEHLAHEYNRLLKTDIVSFRIPGVYGPGVKVGARGVNLIGTQGGMGLPVNFPYSSEQHIVLAHVDDIAEVFAKALLAPTLPHEVYQIGGRYVSFGELADIGRSLMPGMQISFNERAPAMPVPAIDSSRMERELDIQHRTLEDGYRELIALTRQENGLSALS